VKNKRIENIGEYSTSLSFREQTLSILEKILLPIHSSLATSFNNGYKNIDDYLKAVLFHGKSIEISEKTLPSNHLNIVASYNNIGLVCNNMAKYLKYEHALHIVECSASPDPSSVIDLQWKIEDVKAKIAV